MEEEAADYFESLQTLDVSNLSVSLGRFDLHVPFFLPQLKRFLQIDMDHPDEVDDEDDDQIFSALSAGWAIIFVPHPSLFCVCCQSHAPPPPARSEPHLLDIGVDPEDYAAAKAGRFDDEEEES